jgi:hypothetical protein
VFSNGLFDVTDEVTSGTPTSALVRARAGERRVPSSTGSLFHPVFQLATLDAGTADFAYAVGSRPSGTLAPVVRVISKSFSVP